MTGQDNNKKTPAEIQDFLDKIGPRSLTPEEARALNLLRLKYGMSGITSAGIADDINRDE